MGEKKKFAYEFQLRTVILPEAIPVVDHASDDPGYTRNVAVTKWDFPFSICDLFRM